MLKIVFLNTFLLFNFINLIAQETDLVESEALPRVYMADLNLLISDPLSRLSDRVHNPGFGFGGAFYFQLKPEKPVFIGLQLQYHHVDDYKDYFIDLTATDPYEVESTTTTSQLRLSLVPRFYTDFSPFGLQTYIDAALGGNIIYTSTSTSAVEFDETGFTINESDFTICYAIGAGGQYQLNEYTYLDISVKYSSTLSVSYYYHDEDLLPVNPVSTFDYFSQGKGTIPYLHYGVGVTFVF